MKHYFFDAAEQQLYVFDGATEEMHVLPKLKVRVILGLSDLEDNKTKRGELTGGVMSGESVRGRRKCSKCGQSGHTSRTCEN